MIADCHFVMTVALLFLRNLVLAFTNDIFLLGILYRNLLYLIKGLRKIVENDRLMGTPKN